LHYDASGVFGIASMVTAAHLVRSIGSIGSYTDEASRQGQPGSGSHPAWRWMVCLCVCLVLEDGLDSMGLLSRLGLALRAFFDSNRSEFPLGIMFLSFMYVYVSEYAIYDM
jgi:hypothetical protein